MAGTCEAPQDGRGYLSPLNPVRRECKKSRFQTSRGGGRRGGSGDRETKPPRWADLMAGGRDCRTGRPPPLNKVDISDCDTEHHRILSNLIMKLFFFNS